MIQANRRQPGMNPFLKQKSKKPNHRSDWAFCLIGLRGQDLNLRPSGYEPDELPDCSTPRQRGRNIDTEASKVKVYFKKYQKKASANLNVRPTPLKPSSGTRKRPASRCVPTRQRGARVHFPRPPLNGKAPNLTIGDVRAWGSDAPPPANAD